MDEETQKSGVDIDIDATPDTNLANPPVKKPVIPTPPPVTPPAAPPAAPATPQPPIQKSGSREYFEPLQSGQYPMPSKQPAPPTTPPQSVPQVSPAQSPQQIRSGLQAAVGSYLPEEDRKQTGGAQTPQPPVSQNPNIETLRTYKTDVAEAVRKQQTSVIKVAVAEEKRRIDRGEKSDVYKESRGNMVMIFLSIFLILAGAGASYAAYKYYTRPAKQSEIVLAGKPIVATDYQKEIKTDGLSATALIEQINDEGNKNLSLGSVESIYFTKNVPAGNNIVPLDQFISLSSLKMPEVLVRSLGDDFMLGIHFIKGGKKFLIVKPSFYAGAYSAALNWESTMAVDLAPILGTAKTMKSLFVDKVVQNKDTRVLYDEEGNVVIMYSFVDKDHMIITQDEETLTQIFKRLTQAVKAIQ